MPALNVSTGAFFIFLGTIVIAGMREVGYSKEFAAGIICNAGTLGILIPPSIVMVVYAAATDVSVGRMFLAGVFPGLLAGLMLMIGIYIYAKVKGLPLTAANIRDHMRKVANPPGEIVYPGDFDKAFALLRAGKAINYEGAAGSVDFDKHGDVVTPIEIWEYRDGKLKTLRTESP